VLAAVSAVFPANGQRASASPGVTISFSYSPAYIFDTPALANQWIAIVKQQWKKLHPNVALDPIPISGSYNDIVTKEALDFRSPSTTPDITLIQTAAIAEFASAGYLLPLNSYLKSANPSWWRGFPTVVKSEADSNGQIYGVDTVENTTALMYSEPVFKKAGLPVPWHPKTWAAVLAAAEKIKATDPKVIPLFMQAGTGSGTLTTDFGIDDLILGTSTPQIYDAKTGKWVVNSPGIRAALTFYKAVSAKGLAAPLTDLFSPNGLLLPMTLYPESKLGITLGVNFDETCWAKTVGCPYWADAKSVGVAPFPTEFGAKPGEVSTLLGLDAAIAKTSKHPQLAFDLIQVWESAANDIFMCNATGGIPPNAANWALPAFKNFVPYQTLFADLVPTAILPPNLKAYPAWAQAVNLATEQLALHPAISVSEAVQTLSSYLNEQLGSTSTETIG
jgi:multiple sugar transport system substrate-binding protein